jgi:hypothetical protein
MNLQPTKAHGLQGQADSTQLEFWQVEASQSHITKVTLASHSYYNMSKMGHHFPLWLAMTYLAQCGGLNENGLHRLISWNICFPVNCLGRMRRSGCVEGKLRRVGFEISKAYTRSSFSLPTDQGSSLSSFSSTMPACYHVFCQDDNELTLWNCKPAPSEMFSFYKGCLGQGASLQQ